MSARAGNVRRCGFVVASLCAAAAFAQQPSDTVIGQKKPEQQRVVGSHIDLVASAFRTDNALRTPTDPLEDTIYSLGSRLTVRHDGPYFDASLDGNFDWIDYAEAEYDSTVLGFFDGKMSMSSRSEGFRWTLRESYGQLRRNAYSADTLNNFEEVNYLTTGPSAQVSVAENTRLLGYAEYSRSAHERSALDSNQWRVGLSMLQGARADAGLSVHVVAERNEFGEEAPAGSDFDAHIAFVRYEVTNPRLNVQADAGYAQIRSDLVEDESPLLRLVVTRTLGAATSMYLHAAQEYSTAVNAMRASAENRALLGGSQFGQYSHLATTDAFQHRYAELGFTYDRARTTLTFGGSWDEERYRSQSEFDRDSFGVYAAITRQIRPTVFVRVEGSIRNEHFLNGASDSDETQILFDLGKSIGPKTDVVLSYQIFERKDDENALSSFDETRFGITIRHRLLDRR